MESIFGNSGYLIIATMAVSAPIIIHLINRLRFKRIRWAAMEFLLKAQKKSRKRLILEQLLLLLLRCLLVALIGFLVVRFLGFGDSGKESLRKTVHFILVDDSLSMQDTHHKQAKTCFEYAKEAVIEKIAKEVRKPNHDDQVVLIPASRIALTSGYEPKSFDKLHDEANMNELRAAITEMKQTNLHVNLGQAAKEVHERIKALTETQVYLHILSDFRQSDWAESTGGPLHKSIQEMVDADKVKVQLLDMSDWQGFAYPKANLNAAIVDFQPEVKVAGKGMPVGFTIDVRNFSAEPAAVHLKIFDGISGKENFQVNFYPSQPMKVAPKASQKVRFEMRFYPEIRDNKAHLAPLVAVLKNLQDEDKKEGLDIDNVRFAAVEIRNQVPILILDGEAGTTKEERDLDSFLLGPAIESIPGESYVPIRADKLTGGAAVKALERSDLHQYPVVMLTNIRELNQKQYDNLDKFVKNGGGVAFFMGPLVSPKYYNDKLYADGKGMFPAPLRAEYEPPSNEDPRKLEYSGFPQLLIRQDLFPNDDSFPIFGKIDPRAFASFSDFPVHRYFPVDQGSWKKEKGKVLELATLPNDKAIGSYQAQALKLINDPRLAKYENRFNKYWTRIRKVVEPGSPKKAQHLSFELDLLLSDKGTGKADDPANMAEFWNSTDKNIVALKGEITALRNELRYGDPLVLGRYYGQGKVVAVMTSAGKVWSDFAGGSGSTLLYEPFIYETLNFLASSTGENQRTVGSTVVITAEKDAFQGRQVALAHKFSRLDAGERDAEQSYALKESDKGSINPETTDEHLRFTSERNMAPGQSIFTVTGEDESLKKNPLWYWYVFNVDATREGDLERVNPSEIDDKLIGPDRKKSIAFVQPNSGRKLDGDSFLNKKDDYSESPYLFLIILIVLVLEQAMAVHLSYHLKGGEQEGLSRLMRPSAVPASDQQTLSV